MQTAFVEQRNQVKKCFTQELLKISQTAQNDRKSQSWLLLRLGETQPITSKTFC